MDADGTDARTEASCGCKVGRIATRYALDGLDEELVDRWLGEDGDRQSLRELEAYVNRQVLGAAMAEAGMDALDGEAENVYRLLTAEDTSEGQRTETRHRLRRSGVDVAAVESAFVSHQTVHSHLGECLGVDRRRDNPDPSERRERAIETIAALRGRTEAVTESSLEQLAAVGAVTPATFDVIVDVSVTCGRCGRVHSVIDLLRDGGCACD